MKTVELLLEKEACDSAIRWAQDYPDYRAAWDNCEKGWWLLWIASKLGVDRKKLTLVKGLCANTVRHMMKDYRSVAAVDAAIAYGKGEKELGDVSAVFAAANVAANSVVRVGKITKEVAAIYAAEFFSPVPSGRAHFDLVNYDISGVIFTVIIDDENNKKTAAICREVLTEEVFNILKIKNYVDNNSTDISGGCFGSNGMDR